MAQEGDEGAFAEGVGEAGMKGESGILLGKDLDPFGLGSLSVTIVCLNVFHRINLNRQLQNDMRNLNVCPITKQSLSNPRVASSGSLLKDKAFRTWVAMPRRQRAMSRSGFDLPKP